MNRRRYDVLLLLGSNIEPVRRVPQALALLDDRFDLRAVSRTVIGAAIGGGGTQPEFHNLAVRIRTDLPYRALRLACRRIEEACGRRRTADRFAPRTMDIDIAFGDPAFTAGAEGAVPDPELHQHGYSIGPAAEVWGDAIHPRTGLTLAAHRDLLLDAGSD